MTGLLDVPLAEVKLSLSAVASRKYAYTLEMIKVYEQEAGVNGTWVGVHSAKANDIARELLVRGVLSASL